MSDTPRTDAEAAFVIRKTAEELERECDQLRKDLKDSQTAVQRRSQYQQKAPHSVKITTNPPQISTKLAL